MVLATHFKKYKIENALQLFQELFCIALMKHKQQYKTKTYFY